MGGGRMTMTFDDFKTSIKEGLLSGKIKVLNKAAYEAVNSELSLALQYAIGEEMTLKGAPLTATSAELAMLIRKHCGDEVYNRVLPEADA